jgi:5-hydroxyisourate hydrolase-like protein (transthyretin family)
MNKRGSCNVKKYRFYIASFLLLFLIITILLPSLQYLKIRGNPALRFRLGVSVSSNMIRGFGAKHGITIDLNYEGGRKFYDYMTKGPGFFSYIDFAIRLYAFWAGPGEREFLMGMLDRADEEGSKVEISIKLYSLDLGWPGWEPYLYLLLEAIGPSRPSMRYIFLAGEWSYMNKQPPSWDDLYADFQRAKQIVNSYGYELGWGGEDKYLYNIPKERYSDFYALGPRKRACQLSRNPNCTEGAQRCYVDANQWERPNDIFLEAFTMWDREANIPNTPPYYICYDKFKEFIHAAADRFDASNGAYPQAVVFEIMPETYNDVEGVDCPYLDWWQEFAETYDLMVYSNAVKVRDSPGPYPSSPFPPYPIGLKYQNRDENLPPFCVESRGIFKGSVAARNEYTRDPLANREIEIYLIKRTPRAGGAPWYPLPMTKEEWSSMILVGRVMTGFDGWASGFTLPAPLEPGYYTVVAHVPSSGQEMEAFSDVLEGIWVVERAYRIEVRSNVKARLNFGPSAYGPPWQNCDHERWVEPNSPVVGNCVQGEWTFVMPSEVTDSQGKTWVFSHWGNGSTNPIYTISVEKDLVLEAYYSVPDAKSKLNVNGYVKDDRNYPLVGALVTVNSSIDRVTIITDSQGKYAVTLSVNGPGDTVGVTATYHGRSGSASSTLPYETSSMQMDVMVPRTSTRISCSVSPSTVRINESVTVSGDISPAIGGAIVTLTYTKPDASLFTRVVTTSSNGAYSDNYIPDQLGSYSVIASWSGNEDYGGATSLPTSFMVRKNPSSISIKLDATSIVQGSTLRISGALSPALSNVKIVLSYRVKGGSWVELRNLSTDSNGRFSYVWTNTPSVEGEYELSASWSGNDYYEGSSCSISFIVLKVVNPPEPDFSFTIEEPSLPAAREPVQNTTVILSAPNFTVSANPKIIMIPRMGGYNTSVAISVLSLSNYTIEPSLKVGGIPKGIEAELGLQTLSIQRFDSNLTTLVIRTDANPPEEGNYSILVECSYKGVVKEELITLLVIDRMPTVLRVNTTLASVKYDDTFFINGSVLPQHQARITVTAILKNGTEINMTTFNTDEMGAFSQDIHILLTPDEYIVRVLCEEDVFYLESVLNLTLRIEKASLIITLSSNNTRASSEEPVFLNGIVTTARGKPVQNINVTIAVSGETGITRIYTKTDEKGKYEAVIRGLSPSKFDVVSLVSGNNYYESARSITIKLEIQHPASQTMNNILYPIVSLALIILILIISIRVLVSTVHEIREERSYMANRLKVTCYLGLVSRWIMNSLVFALTLKTAPLKSDQIV